MRKMIPLMFFIILISFSTACSQNNSASAASPTPLRPGINEAIQDALTNPEVFAALNQLNELFTIYPSMIHHEKNTIQGGWLHLPLLNEAERRGDPVFTGLLHPLLAETQFDQDISHILIPSLLSFDEDGRIIWGSNHNGPVTINFLESTNTISISMRDNVRIFWHDGVELTLEDLHYAFLVLLHPDFPRGIHRDMYRMWHHLAGATQYNMGLTEYISGITVSADGRRMLMQFNGFVSANDFNDFFIGTPLPFHILNAIPMDDLTNHPFAREHLVGFGPFKLDMIDPGERVVMVANENYWQGPPLLDGIVFYLDPANTGTMFANGELDVLRVHTGQANRIHESGQGYLLGSMSPVHSVFMFNLGATIFDYTRGEFMHIPRSDEHAINNPQFRSALAYAFDQNKLDEAVLSQSATTPATSFHHPVHSALFIDPDSPGLTAFNLDRANLLLDEAGFRWGDDGFRMHEDGSRININLGITWWWGERLFPILSENFQQIGVQLSRAYTENMRHSRFFDTHEPPWLTHHQIMVESLRPYNNGSMHMFFMTLNEHLTQPMFEILWCLQMQTYGSPFLQFVHPELDLLLDEFRALAVDDEEGFRDVLQRADRFFIEQVPLIPTSWRLHVDAVNRRVANWSTCRSRHMTDSFAWHRVGVTSHQAYRG